MHERGILFSSSNDELRNDDRKVLEKTYSFDDTINVVSRRTSTSDEWSGCDSKMVSHEEALRYDAIIAMILKYF